MAKYLELASGCMLDVEDIIYISDVKPEAIDSSKYTFNIIWAHRINKEMVYNSRVAALEDQICLKNYIKNMH